MKTHFQTGRFALAAALCAIAIPAAAQVAHPGTSGLMVAPPIPDADALAEQMRILAHDPKNADALIKAYGVDSTPSIVVNGKYRVTATSAGGWDKVQPLVNWLIAQESHK